MKIKEKKKGLVHKEEEEKEKGKDEIEKLYRRGME